MEKKEKYFVDKTCKIGKGKKIYPGVVVENNCNIGKNVTIQNGSLISNNVTIGDNCFIGPFTVIRENTTIGNNVLVGPHCEITRSNIGVNSKIAHRTYLGDVTVHDNVSIGCGTVLANTNFSDRYKSSIGSNTLIGANVTLVSPITIGSNCFVAAGTILAKDLPDSSFIRLSLDYYTKKN